MTDGTTSLLNELARQISPSDLRQVASQGSTIDNVPKTTDELLAPLRDLALPATQSDTMIESLLLFLCAHANHETHAQNAPLMIYASVLVLSAIYHGRGVDAEELSLMIIASHAKTLGPRASAALILLLCTWGAAKQLEQIVLYSLCRGIVASSIASTEIAIMQDSERLFMAQLAAAISPATVWPRTSREALLGSATPTVALQAFAAARRDLAHSLHTIENSVLASRGDSPP